MTQEPYGSEGINESFRYLHMGLPPDILRRKLCGDIQGALRLIDRRLSMEQTPLALRHCLTAQREMLLRLPEEYPFTRNQALAKIRKYIPEFTEEEFEERVEAGTIGWIYVNGSIRFFGRFFETLCKTEPAFALRSGVSLPGAESSSASSQKEQSLERCIQKLKQQGRLRFRIRIRASLKIKEEFFVPGMRVRVHLPIPAACPEQSQIIIEKLSPPDGLPAPENALQRTVCWEMVLTENREFSVEYSYVRAAAYRGPLLTGDDEAPGGTIPIPEDCFTAEEPPHVLFTPYIRELAERLSAGTAEPLEKARRFYDFITLNMTYTFMPSYFVLENIAENCALSLTGDCGVFALLFLTLCRCVKIPARWQSGLTAEPDFCGAHDWVQFYAAPYGWLHADPSYGLAAARTKNEARRQFYFGSLDPFRMTANQAFQAPFAPKKLHWRADPYDNQVGEIETDVRGLRYGEYERYKQVLLCQELN